MGSIEIGAGLSRIQSENGAVKTGRVAGEFIVPIPKRITKYTGNFGVQGNLPVGAKHDIPTLGYRYGGHEQRLSSKITEGSVDLGTFVEKATWKFQMPSRVWPFVDFNYHAPTLTRFLPLPSYFDRLKLAVGYGVSHFSHDPRIATEEITTNYQRVYGYWYPTVLAVNVIDPGTGQKQSGFTGNWNTTVRLILKHITQEDGLRNPGIDVFIRRRANLTDIEALRGKTWEGGIHINF